MRMERVLITGGNGALARRIATKLESLSVPVSLAGRSRPAPHGGRSVEVGPIGPDTDWGEALKGVSHVVHGAAMTQLAANESEADFDLVNRGGTLALAEQAADAGVVRFVHISSASVMGRVSGGAPLSVGDAPRPESAYSRSKLAAEQALATIASSTRMAVVVLRPPRIVGDPLSGNLALFQRLIARGVPLPFGAITTNRRDNVSPGNLVGLILLALTHPEAAGRTFFATDDDPLSTRTLAERIASRSGGKARLIPVPAPLLRTIVRGMPKRLLGRLSRQEMAAELTESFHLDMAPARDLLGWQAEPGTL